MYRLSLFFKILIIGLVITLFTNSIGYAKEPSIPSASSNCGEWKMEIADSSNDNRIGVTLLQQASGNDCAGTFTLENRTGTFLGGGYSLELTTFSNNANALFLPYGDPFLVPGLNIEIKTIPIDINKQASTNLQGEVTLGSFSVDLSFFIMKTIIDLIPLPTGCLISYDQLFLISLRTAPILENSARLVFEGDLIGSKAELSRVITVFHEKAADTARDIGLGCFADFLKSILGKPVVIAKIVLSYLTWVPVVIFDYFKFQGMPIIVRLSYFPPTPSPEVPTTSTPAAPLIVSISPTSPALVGVCIVVKVRIDWDPLYGSIRVRFGDEGWHESSETEFKRIFCTEEYQPGVYKIHVEARQNDDNSWSHPKVTEVDYQLKSLEEIYPGVVVFFGSARQTFDARVGSELYHIQGGRVMNYQIQRWLVPNTMTAVALCIPPELQGNMWNLPDSDILAIPRGPDIPDILTQPDKFWEVRNQYFPYCNWIPPQP